MPYIKRQQRSAIDILIDNIPISSPGELNYCITRLIIDYIEGRKKVNKGKVSYQDINDALGATEGAKLEFYRRFAADYEDAKKKENGDVY